MTTRWARLVASSRILDVVVIALTVALAITSIITSEPFGPSALNLALVALACVAVPWRDRYPEPVLAVALLAFVATGTPAPTMLAMGSLAAVHGSRVRTSIAAAVASVAVVVPSSTIQIRCGPSWSGGCSSACPRPSASTSGRGKS